MLNKSDEWSSCLVLDIRNEVLIFTIEHDASHGLSYIVFIMLRCVPYTPNLLKVFNHESMLYFVKCFFCLCEIIACLKKKTFILLMCCITFIDLYPRDKPLFVVVIILLRYCSISFANILLRVFASIFIR